MPTTFRFLKILLLAAIVVYGALFALSVLVEPNVQPIEVRVPLDRFERDGG